jgi:hypothetical protein
MASKKALKKKKQAAWCEAQEKLLPLMCRTVVEHLPSKWVELSNVVSKNMVPSQLDTITI